MTNDGGRGIEDHPVVSHEEWLAARKALLAKEKAFTRLRDDLSRQRRELPWEPVEKEYAFEGPQGRQTLSQLFDGRSQLIVYHFMFGPDWEAGCGTCSFWADNFNGVIVHLNHRDATMIAVSRAPYEKLAAYERKMGWSFKWVSSFGTDFNFDYHVSFTPAEVAEKKAFYNYTVQDPHETEREGVSVFYKDPAGRLFHAYSSFARGIDMVNTAYHYLDLLPKGRDEGDRGPYWLRRHDEYGR
ncbi:MAG TPA: thioredoxin family protein [Thermoanaerobaculia bacterium]|nr:thioredoxin family protein [Thermoanaerobaculia bacterium]